MSLAYLVVALVSFLAYLLMAGIDTRLRVGVAAGLFICLVAIATCYVTWVGDASRPGSVEVTPAELDRVTPASSPK